MRPSRRVKKSILPMWGVLLSRCVCKKSKKIIEFTYCIADKKKLDRRT